MYFFLKDFCFEFLYLLLYLHLPSTSDSRFFLEIDPGLFNPFPIHNKYTVWHEYEHN